MTVTLYPRAEVFAVAEWAQRQRRPASLAVAAHFGVSAAHAKTLIRATRKLGFPLPLLRASTAHPARQLQVRQRDLTGRRLECACGWTVPLTDWAAGERLAQHTISAHHRAPTTGERTPTGNEAPA